MAAPVHPQLSSLAIPSPNSTTYEADIAAVVAYAHSHPAPVTAMDTTIAAAPVKECGAYTRMGDNSGTLTYTSEVCKDTAGFEHMEDFFNWYCDLCIVFDGTACQGAIRWNGTRTHCGYDDKHHVHGAQSYFCN
ncbi:hypothetical protein COCCADRAFT_92372 [Bipolaris zeicola 26-R-13]|uniref:Uncharacterized protein n=1 Tax=Cochliobolus carbonum (strain 26-R-13) TaxID=930089 RepID=W6YTP2_COCC2|nr:uncharacterized protein COCCADRAFT_92372 [Bipolaris zeicola 26-R-13]EUC34881.1 hypothetical protein COCCADRAFT_92372 [Bipolaris zeicola 26-R-13]